MGLKSKKELKIRLEHEGKVLYEISASEITSEITIGRAQDSTWCIPATDRAASNKHAAIVKKRGSLVVVDRGSRNGIYFQGAKVPEHKLAAGDQVGIGDCRLYAEMPEVGAGKGPEREFNQLEQLNGEKKGTIYKLDKPSVRIGSASDCEIILNDSVVSHFHASVEQKNDGSSWIRDLGSRNGTQVNGTPLSGSANDSGRLLKDGDVITISYIELKYWDKYAVHVRSHWILKTITVILTIAIMLMGYNIWQEARPSAKKEIDYAREAARHCDFATARVHLENAKTARKAERYRSERKELANQVDQWEETVKNWSDVKELLKKKQWITANKILSPMLSQNMEMWRWNDTDANVAKNEAIATKQVIDTYLEGRGILEDEESSLERLQNATDSLSTQIVALQGKSLDFCTELLAYSSDIEKELKLTTSSLREIEKRLQELDALEKLDDVVRGLEKIRDEAKTHVDERVKGKNGLNRYSSKPLRMAKDVLEPLYKLQKAKGVLDGNIAAVAALQFDKKSKVLPLPTVEECAVYPIMADKRLLIEKLFKQLDTDALQLERIVKALKNAGMELGKTPPCVAALSDTAAINAVLDCDCFKLPIPKYSRTEGESQYDRILGVETFVDFLSQLPGEFDSSILEERPFMPEIFKARSLYGYLETLLSFLEKDTLKMLKELKTNNKVMELALGVDDILMQRDALVQQLLQRYNASEKRDGVIAGGMALLLAKSKVLPSDMGEEVQTKYRRIRQKILAMDEGEKTPEQIIANRKKVLEIGIPGDSMVKPAWVAERPLN
ncbi:MAG: FHA domain-containing protein [Victivallales bacterium]|nr:FHA domain-containing protein [Victivallales bacterium]